MSNANPQLELMQCIHGVTLTLRIEISAEACRIWPELLPVLQRSENIRDEVRIGQNLFGGPLLKEAPELLTQVQQAVYRNLDWASSEILFARLAAERGSKQSS